MEKIKNFFHHLFIPQQKNNYQAKTLHTDFLMFYLIIAVVFTFVFKNSSGLKNVLGFATDISTEKLFQLTNEERTKNNLPQLTYSDCLAKAAYKKAQDMFAKNYWAHFSPDGTTTPWTFMMDTGCKYEYAGENLAKNFMFSDGVITAWMNSPTHKENIINKNYTEVGFAIVNGILNGEQTTLVVQMFDKPLENAAVAKQPVIENVSGVSEKSVVKSVAKNKLLSNLPLSVNLIFIIFLMVALGFDFYFASKLNIIRFSGKNLAHFIFVMFVLLGVIYGVTIGAIA